MIIKLNNPMTELYVDFKEMVNSGTFPWFVQSTFQPKKKKVIKNIPEGLTEDDFGTHEFFAHPILERPEISGISNPLSKAIEDVLEMYREFKDVGLVEKNSFLLRACLNLTTPYVSGPRYSIPHCDHKFDHTNMLMYLTDAGGRTFVGDEEFDPKEDDIILFKGEHYNELPESKNRIVLVLTLLTW